MKLAAIDIGSNAARLLISEVIKNDDDSVRFNKINLVRVPLRLGFDVFEHRMISVERRQMILETMRAYRHLLNAYGVEHCIACATSAMRDASNAKDIINQVKQETNINIEVISGDMEANLLYENHIAESLPKSSAYLYIDVGGGSTELSFFINNELHAKKSFNIGTIRLLKKQVKEKQWDEVKDFLKSTAKPLKSVISIGSGGNINKIFSISKRKEGKPLHIDLLKDYYREFGSISVAERMRLYKFREDRADVIVPALSIYINCMRWANATEIYVPRIGLADGLIQHLYSEITQQVP